MKSKADYKNKILTLDLPGAIEPMLWRQPLANLSACAFIVQRQADGTHAIVLRQQDSADQIITTFADMEGAQGVLDALRPVLKRAARGKFAWLVWLWIPVILGGLYGILHIAVTIWAEGLVKQVLDDPGAINTGDDEIGESRSAPDTETMTEQEVIAVENPQSEVIEGGVPLLADDVLPPPLEE